MGYKRKVTLVTTKYNNTCDTQYMDAIIAVVRLYFFIEDVKVPDNERRYRFNRAGLIVFL